MIMCDVNGPFKLCTCDSDLDLKKPHWILHRFIKTREVINVMGLFYQPEPYVKISLRSLKRRLNSINVFDKDINDALLNKTSMTDFNNQIINASNQLVLFPKNKVNLTIQDLINYRSDSETRMIHKLTVGIKVKISKS